MARRATFMLTSLLLVAAAAIWFYGEGARPELAIAAEEIGAFGFHAGELVQDFDYEDTEGNEGTLISLLEGSSAVVIVMRTSECPVSRRYGHRLAEMEREYGARGVRFAYLNVSPQDTPEKMAGDIEKFGLTGPYIVDPDGEIGAALQARVSTEVFVIDAAHTLRYRGAIDDQYGIDFAKPKPQGHFLRDALDAVLAGERVEVAETLASGCFLELGATRVAARDLTYHSRISRIINDNCVSCHRDGGVAPFALDSYEQAYGFREMIKFMVSDRRMPPWFASPEHGTFANDRSLSERDLRDLIAWVDAGGPAGDPSLAPLARTFAEGWALESEPDVIIQIPDALPVPKQGVLDYQHIYVKTDFDEDLWVTAAELRPTAPQVTHHIIVYKEEPGAERRGPWLASYAPGMPPQVFPEGTGRRIRKGEWLMFELHYTTNGTEAVDQAMMGLVLAHEKPELEMVTDFVGNTDFEIPAHAPDHEVVAERTFKRAGTIYELLPHMHLRGKAFRYELIRADGTRETLLDVPRYDFNWQLTYTFEEPLRVEPGDMIRGYALFDNSAGNPANPDPDNPVRYGEQSFEEMMFGFFRWTRDPVTRSETDGAGQ